MKKETNYNVREFFKNYETELHETPWQQICKSRGNG